MSITATKTWVNQEVLTSTDLNARFANIESQVLPAAAQGDVNLMTSTTMSLTPNINKIVLGTQQASTSGTVILFSNIPSGVRRITIMLSGVSTSGTNNLIIQIGDAGGIETSGYLGSGTTITTATPATANFTSGFGLTNTTLAAMLVHGSATLTLMNAATNTWACTSTLGHSNAGTISIGAGVKSTSAELNQVQVTSVGSTDTFDAGAINISYER